MGCLGSRVASWSSPHDKDQRKNATRNVPQVGHRSARIIERVRQSHAALADDPPETCLDVGRILEVGPDHLTGLTFDKRM